MKSGEASSQIEDGFTHLEVHSYYTLLEATPSVEELVAQAKAEGSTHLALTDTNALYGAVVFQRACLEAGIQPIIGMTLNVAPPPDIGSRFYDEPGHLVLLAKGSDGYRSLCRISSFIQGSPDRETLAKRGLDWDSIAGKADGLICLSGGRKGWIERFLRDGNQEEAGRYAARLGGLFGEDAHLSLEIHSAEDLEIAREVENLGHRFGLSTVAVQPIYCLEPVDVSRLQLLQAINKNIHLEDVRKAASKSADKHDFHWLNYKQVAQRFERFPGAMERTAAIALRCQPALPGGQPIWPVLNLPKGKSPDQALEEMARAGFEAKYGSEISDEVNQRLNKELAAIGHSGFTPLFLIVADIVRHAVQTGVPVSTRGSVANSLVAYCLGITTVDPVAHDLLFERFLNPARTTPPDIDLDFCSRRRDEILTYVRKTYGDDKVALVATISTLRPKSAVRETGKAFGLGEEEIGRLAKSLPRDWHPDPRRRSKRTVDDLLAELDEPRLKQVVSAAYELIGYPHHLSVHPGGVVITPGPLTDYVPVQMAPKGFLITQFDHKDLESLGLPKLDLLGISALTVMSDAADLVRIYYDPKFRLQDIPMGDAPTGDMLEAGWTIGVFQCESAGAQRTLRQLKARTVPDLAVANAFFKPGPATGGMAQAFIRRYRGEERVSYLHPTLEPILAPTKGVLLFQEQILRVATEIAGLSWEEANQLRRGISKFQAHEMESLQTQFIAGCTRPTPSGPGFTSSQANTLWEQVLAFAGYGFNQGHATAYADVSYRTAYLKLHWPAAFFCARLADWGGFHHPAVYSAEAVRLGIPIQPPHVNHSLKSFTLTFDDLPPEPSPPAEFLSAKASPLAKSPILWMGLGQVRGLRRYSIAEIMRMRKDGQYNRLDDLLERVTLQTKEIIHLIQCGALDGLGRSRAALLAQAEAYQRAGSTKQMAFSFAGELDSPAESLNQRMRWEKAILGRPVSVHPLDLLEQRPAETVQLLDLPGTQGQEVAVSGVRLPGWTGGPGFFLADQETFIIARGDKSLKPPEPWSPVLVRGRWTSDEWGTSWLQVERLRPL